MTVSFPFAALSSAPLAGRVSVPKASEQDGCQRAGREAQAEATAGHQGTWAGAGTGGRIGGGGSPAIERVGDGTPRPVSGREDRRALRRQENCVRGDAEGLRVSKRTVLFRRFASQFPRPHPSDRSDPEPYPASDSRICVSLGVKGGALESSGAFSLDHEYCGLGPMRRKLSWLPKQRRLRSAAARPRCPRRRAPSQSAGCLRRQTARP